MVKNVIKYSILSVIIIFIVILCFFIYKNIFAGTESSRYKDIEKYNVTNDEINSVKGKINELENIESIDIDVRSKIINIIVNINEDISFDDIKNIANESILGFSENNLKFYDVQFYVQSKNSESEIYPQIGYKFKANSEFSW